MNRLEFFLDIKDTKKGPRRVNVRGDLTTRELISAAKDHFNLDGQFELLMGPTRQGLPAEIALREAGVTDGVTLECVRLRELSNTPDLIESGDKRRFSQKFGRVFFMDQKTRAEFDLAWWPAIIGRRDRSDPGHNRLLAVDLEPLESVPTVSRHHACVSEANGSFFVETLQARNPAYLEGARLSIGRRYPLPTGSSLQIGEVHLNFNIRD